MLDVIVVAGTCNGDTSRAADTLEVSEATIEGLLNGRFWLDLATIARIGRNHRVALWSQRHTAGPGLARRSLSRGEGDARLVGGSGSGPSHEVRFGAGGASRVCCMVAESVEFPFREDLPRRAGGRAPIRG